MRDGPVITASRGEVIATGKTLTSKTTDERFMRLAIEQAHIGASLSGAGEVGCIIVRDNAVVASGYNEAGMQFDPTGHAEIVTLRKLGKQERRIKFPGCTLYVTLQPCTMCTAASVWAGIDRIVYGASRCDVHPMYFEAKHIDPIDIIQDAYKSAIEIAGSVLAEECSGLYYTPGDNPPPEEQLNS